MGVEADFDACQRILAAMIRAHRDDLVASVMERDDLGRALTDADVAALIDDLADSLEGPPRQPRSARTKCAFARDRARACHATVQVVFGFVEGRGGSMTLEEARIMHDWAVRSLVEHFDRLAEARELAVLREERSRAARAQLMRRLAGRDAAMATLAHDLRAPLTAIVLVAERFLAEKDPAADAARAVARIKRAARRMQELVHTLLESTAARVQGELPIAPVPMDLSEVARAIVDELRAGSPAHDLRVDVAGDTKGTWDPARMAQVISNITGNALEHAEATSTVTVSLLGGSDQVVLTVSNRGPVIPAELISRLFEPFWRGASPGSKGGLGLGLFIADRIVRGHGGAIEVASTDEGGTHFTVRLPRHAPALLPRGSDGRATRSR